jgi:outer membrane protein TolC
MRLGSLAEPNPAPRGVPARVPLCSFGGLSAEGRIARVASMADLEELLEAVDRAKERRDRARTQHEQARDALGRALRRAHKAGASYRDLGARLGVYHGEVQRLMGDMKPKKMKK